MYKNREIIKLTIEIGLSFTALTTLVCEYSLVSKWVKVRKEIGRLY